MASCIACCDSASAQHKLQGKLKTTEGRTPNGMHLCSHGIALAYAPGREGDNTAPHAIEA